MKSVLELRRFINNHNELAGSELWDELDSIASDIEYDVDDVTNELINTRSEIESLERRLEELE